eukprot:12885429-Alexandrium_andersonii.AAC.1
MPQSFAEALGDGMPVQGIHPPRHVQELSLAWPARFGPMCWCPLDAPGSDCGDAKTTAQSRPNQRQVNRK